MGDGWRCCFLKAPPDLLASLRSRWYANRKVQKLFWIGSHTYKGHVLRAKVTT